MAARHFCHCEIDDTVTPLIAIRLYFSVKSNLEPAISSECFTIRITGKCVSQQAPIKMYNGEVIR